MTDDEATLAVIDALEQENIAYVVVGSMASNVYGIPRSTEDADFVVQLGDGGLSGLMARLGPSFRLDPQLSFETFTWTTRHVLNVAGLPFTIELFHLSDDPHDQERFRRRQRLKVLGRDAYLPTVEDMLITKLRWAERGRRSKDRDDARDMLAVQQARLDWDYLNLWCDRHGTRPLLDELRRSISST